MAVKCRVLHSVAKDQLNERSMKEGLQEVAKMIQLRVKLRLREERKAGPNNKSA